LDIIPTRQLYNLADKNRALDLYINTMLSRTSRLFKWEGLPDTIPQWALERILQTKGLCAIINVNGELRAIKGALGGRPDWYHRPLDFIVANGYCEGDNPNFKFLSKKYTRDVDCVVVRNDTFEIGLEGLFNRYCTMLVENDISMLVADINARIPNVFSVADDSSKRSAEKVFEDIVAGKIGVIMDDVLNQSAKALPFSSGDGSLTNLIEYQQYIKASMFNDIGLDANYNMKREAINSSEAQMNDDALLPFIDDMLKCRQEACEQINAMFGTNISVDFDSIWKIKEEEQEIAMEQLANPGPENNGEEGTDNATDKEVEEPTV